MVTRNIYRRNALGLPLASLLCLGLFLAACAPREEEPEVESYDVRGQVIEIRLDGEELVVDHENIPGYMAPMRMSFRVRDRAETQNVQPGDSIQFRYVPDSPEGSYIEDIDVLSRHPLPGEPDVDDDLDPDPQTQELG